MKIGFNITSLQTGHKVRGVGFYSQNLLENLLKQKEHKIIQFSSLNELSDVDIVHYPFFDFFEKTLPLNKKFPTIVTIHDTIPLIFPEHYPSGIRGKVNYFFQKLSLKSVQAVVTDSHCSKQDIVNFLNIEEGKVFPIFLAPSKEFKKISSTLMLNKTKKKYDLPNKFVIFVGNVNWNKNLINLTQACIDINMDLVITGSGFEKKQNLNHPELKTLKEFLAKFEKNSKVHILGFVPLEDLVIITNLAESLLLPSYYEGFGIPILEAQACGTPVITGNTSSMPEVAGDGAILVDPKKARDISNAIDSIHKDKLLRKNLIDNGFRNVEKSSWEKTTRETIEIYKKIYED